eukprot:1658068-Rhodomonas_salina.1
MDVLEVDDSSDMSDEQFSPEGNRGGSPRSPSRGTSYEDMTDEQFLAHEKENAERAFKIRLQAPISAVRDDYYDRNRSRSTGSRSSSRSPSRNTSYEDMTDEQFLAHARENAER